MPPSKNGSAPRQGKTQEGSQTGRSEAWARHFAEPTRGKTAVEYSSNRTVFAQGDPADSVFYIRSGKVKLAASSKHGKEAIVAIFIAGEFFGEGCLAGQPLREATAVTMTDSALYRIEKPLMTRMLHEKGDVMELFVTHLLSRNIRYEEDLVDQLFNNSEKRLARMLLLLAQFGNRGRSEPVVPKINQSTLAEMVGTTRSRVSHFMNKFKKQGFIDYKSGGALTVHSGLLSVVLGPRSKPVIQSGLDKPQHHQDSDFPSHEERLTSAQQEPFRRTPFEETNTTLLLSTMRIASSNNCDNRLANDLGAAEGEMWAGRLR